jgi:hypothetical protein
MWLSVAGELFEMSTVLSRYVLAYFGISESKLTTTKVVATTEQPKQAFMHCCGTTNAHSLSLYSFHHF